MKKLSLLLFIHLFVSAINAQVKQGNSLFWEISGNGLSKPSYLYGTMHVSSKTAFHLTDSFFVALKNVDMVALESRPEEWIDGLFNSDLMSSAYSQGGVYTKAYSNEDNDYSLYNIGFSNYIPKRQDLGSILSIEPSLINGILFRTQQARQDFQEDTYLDMFIYQCGKKLGKGTIGLETFYGSMIMEMMASKAQRDEEKLDEVVEEDEEYAEEKGGSYKSYDEKLNEAYRTGNIKALDSLSKKSSGKGFHKYMIVERNRTMAHSYDSIIKSGKSLFAGIGAAHLSGNEGVLQFLKDMGYKVRPMEFSNPKPGKTKTKMEEMEVPTTLSNQYLEKEGISLLGVEKFYTFPTPGNMNFYLTFDLANGSFYFVNTMPTFGAFENKSPEYILDQMDSLVYEFTAGKMVSHKRIKNNLGYPGLEVVSKTKSGNSQKYQFFVGPQKIYSFKVSGKAEYALGKDAEKFFNSISFDNKNREGFSVFKPKHEQYEVSMPNEREFAQNPDGFFNQFQGEKITGVDLKTNDFYCLTKAVYDGTEKLEVDTFELSYFIERIAKNTQADIKNKAFGLSNNRPKISAELTRKNGKFIYIDIVKSGIEYFMLMAQTSKEGRPDEFFNSFKIGKTKYLNKPVEIVDTFLHYKANFIGLSREYCDKNYVNYDKISLSIIGDEDDYYYDDEDDNIEISDEKSERTFVYSDTTGEYVSVRYVLESKYFWEDTVNSNSNGYYENRNWGSFYEPKFLGKNSNADSTTWRRVNKFVNAQRDSCGEYRTSRKGSTEQTYTLRIDKSRATYYITTTIDSVHGLSEFKKVFYNSFIPTDTFPRFDKYADKSVLILKDLYSDDSTTMKTARFGLSIAPKSFCKNNYAELKAAIEDPKFYGLPFAYRQSLIYALEQHPKEKSVIGVLDKIYRNAGDTTDLQLWVLETLSGMKTLDATKKFGELILEETPMSSGDEENSFFHLFYGFQDSVELGVKLLPEFMELMKIPEYKDDIVELLGYLAVKKPLNKDILNANKVMLLREANAEFKRVNTVSSVDVDEEGNESNYEKKEEFDYDDASSVDDFDWTDTTKSFYTENYLGDYITILLPLKDDPAINTLFGKILKSTELKREMPNYIANMKKGGYPIADSIWTNMLKLNETRLEAFYYMQKLGLDKLIEEKYFSADSVVWNELYSNLKSEKDSIILMEKRIVASQYGSGELYIFKRKSDKSKKWNLDFAYVLDDKEYENMPISVNRQKKGVEVKNTTEKLDIEIKKFSDSIRISGRNRAKTNSYNYGYDDYE